MKPRGSVSCAATGSSIPRRESAFDDLTRQAVEACGVPIALVSFVDAKRQWFKSRIGLAHDETPRGESFCAHALLAPERPLIVPDAAADARFADNPAVLAENGIRFYAGIPLRSSEGHGLGTLCVIDHVPRQLSHAQIDRLQAIAQQISIRLSLRRRAPAERPLAGGSALGFALLLAMALLCASAAKRFLASDEWVAHTHQVVSEIERTIFEVQSAESSMRGYTASGKEIYLPPYRAALAALPMHLSILRKAVSDDPAQFQRYQVLQTKVDAKLAVMELRYEQRRTLGPAAVAPFYLNGSGRASMDAITAVGQEMVAVENGLLRERADRRAAELNAAVATVLIASAIAAVLLGVGFWLTPARPAAQPCARRRAHPCEREPAGRGRPNAAARRNV